MPLLGAHTSIAGGLEKTLERGRVTGCDVVQIFTGSSRQWRSPRIGPREIEAFREARKRTAVQPIAVHTHYLINLASPRPEVSETIRRPPWGAGSTGTSTSGKAQT